MPKFTVLRKEIWIAYVPVEAATAEEALELVADDMAEESNCEYLDTMDVDTWSVLDTNNRPVKLGR